MTFILANKHIGVVAVRSKILDGREVRNITISGDKGKLHNKFQVLLELRILYLQIKI